ncbi:MAG: class I SAM-dependent methyltransferase [Vicinamibacterales bacterium]|nr:class I SAM-dependent methyltransferase [Vicinamibacterales bacterium]
MSVPLDLPRLFGSLDIYVFDQILRGRIAPGMRVLDAGCGYGRNLVYLLQAGVDVCAVDANEDAVASVREFAAAVAPHLPATNFRVEPLEAMSFPDAHADVVLSSAVLHFARDEAQFDAMLGACWRVLRPGGLFVSRLASSDGVEGIRPVAGRVGVLPDGSTRYLVDAAYLQGLTARLGGTLDDPLKTTIVHGQRAMATWVVRKAPSMAATIS